MRTCIAMCLSSLAIVACDPIQAQGVPRDFQRRGPEPMDGSIVVVCGNEDCDPGVQRPLRVLAPGQGLDAQQIEDSGVSNIPDSPTFDDGVGCAFILCMPGFECCPFDGTCNPASCFDCCPRVPDVPDAASAGCAFVQCMPGFECCAADGRCNPVSCFDCCPFLPDAETF